MQKKNILELNKKTWIVVVLFLLLTNSLTLFNLFLDSSEEVRAKFRRDYQLLSPERSFYDQKDLIVNIQSLRDQLNEIGKDQNISIYFEFLPTGANISVNKDQKIWPASLMKIPIAFAVMKKIEDGNLQLSDELTLKETNKNSEFGDVYKNPTGKKITVEELLNEMLINSDNTARNMLSEKLQTIDLDDILNHLGIEYDYKNNEQISAKKYSIFWRSLFYSTYLNPENSEKIIEIMAKSSASQYLASVISPEVRFSHKIGVLYDVNSYADSGIVYANNRPYILTVMVKDKNQIEAEKNMHEISRKVYKYISEY
jgi:beta-lactamase class A